MRNFARFDAWMGRVYDLIGALVGISIGLFAIAIALDLLLRLLKVGNLPGMQVIVEYALFAGVFLAAPWVLRLGAHIRIDIVVVALPRPAAALFERGLDFMGLVISCILLWFGGKNLLQAYASGAVQRKYFDVSEWWLLAVLVASFSLLAVEFASRLARVSAPPEAAHDLESGV